MEFVVLATAVADLQETVQKTEDHDNGRETGLERVLRGCPAIGVDRLGSVLGIQVASLRREIAIGGRQMLVVRSFRQAHPEYTALGRRGGHIGFLAIPIGMVFVRGEVFGQSLRITHRGADQTVSARAFHQAMPEHITVSKALCQHPVGHAERSQQQRIVEFVRGSGHVTHGEARPKVKRFATTAGPDFSPLNAVHFLRWPTEAMKGIAFKQAFGEQFGIFGHVAIDYFSHFFRIAPVVVELFTGHGDDNLPIPALGLRRIDRPITIQNPGLLRSIHAHSSCLVTEECAKCPP